MLGGEFICPLIMFLSIPFHFRMTLFYPRFIPYTIYIGDSHLKSFEIPLLLLVGGTPHLYFMLDPSPSLLSSMSSFVQVINEIPHTFILTFNLLHCTPLVPNLTIIVCPF